MFGLLRSGHGVGIGTDTCVARPNPNLPEFVPVKKQVGRSIVESRAPATTLRIKNLRPPHARTTSDMVIPNFARRPSPTVQMEVRKPSTPLEPKNRRMDVKLGGVAS